MTCFAENLHYLRHKKGLTKSAMDNIFKISLNTWSNYEKGTSEPSLEILFDIARFFKVDLQDLVMNNLHTAQRDIDKYLEEFPEMKDHFIAEDSLPIAKFNKDYFTANLCYLRIKKGFIHSGMYNHRPISIIDWTKYEKGNLEPSISVLIDIVTFFQVDIIDLLTGDLEQIKRRNNQLFKDQQELELKFSDAQLPNTNTTSDHMCPFEILTNKLNNAERELRELRLTKARPSLN